jgi:hypothetical protein
MVANGSICFISNYLKFNFVGIIYRDWSFSILNKLMNQIYDCISLDFFLELLYLIKIINYESIVVFRKCKPF